jgi:ABC-2 type transport system permease protein
MSGAVFFETLRRSWRGMLWWGLALGSMTLLQVVIVPDVESLKKIAEMMETMPKFLLDALGTTDMQFMATPEGYITLQWFSFSVLILGVYAVIAGLNVTANEEDRGIMDILLSLPLPRWRIIVEKFAAYTILTTGVIAFTFLGLWIGLLLTPGLNANVGTMLIASFNSLPATILIMAFTVLIAALLRRRNRAAAFAGAFIVGSYLIDTMARAASNPILNVVRYVSFYSYYDPVGVIKNGLVWGNILVLVAASILMVAVGVWAFQRRDVGV